LKNWKLGVTPMADTDFDIVESLTFRFYDFYNEEDQNLLYIEDGDPSSIKLNFEITNNSGKTIKLDPARDSNASPDNFHISLEFRPGELSNVSLQQIDLDGITREGNWTISRPVLKRNGSIFLYLLRIKETLVIEKEHEGKKGKQIITFKGLAANGSNGVRGTNVNGSYNNFYFEDNNKKNKIEKEFLLILTVLGSRGLRKAPLAVSFAYSNAVLNDGKQQNLLIIQISNIGQENIAFSQTTKFIITVDAQLDKKSEPWSLSEKDKANKIEVRVLKPDPGQISDDSKVKAGDKVPNQNIVSDDWECNLDNKAIEPEWTISPKLEKVSNLKFDEDIFIQLSNVITSLKSGQGDIYLSYSGLPGYRSDKVLLGVKKTHLIERENKIGIGKVPESSSPELDVKGKIAADYLEINNKITNPSLQIEGSVTAASFIGEGAAVTGMIMMWYGDKDNIPMGWALCDGSNGTPDLKDRFIMGAGNVSSRQSGDADQHSHRVENLQKENFYTESGGTHRHRMPRTWNVKENALYGSEALLSSDKNFWAIDPGSDRVSESQEGGNHSHQIKINPFDTSSSNGQNRPRWYALYFIIKVTTFNAPFEQLIDVDKDTEWKTATGYKLAFQKDGNFVLHNKDKKALWATGTHNRTEGTKPNLLKLTTDGDFALLDQQSKIIWSTNTSDNPGAYLVFQEDGNLVLYSKNNQILFQTNTANDKQQTTNVASTWKPKG
jgi:hypothetical protein